MIYNNIHYNSASHILRVHVEDENRDNTPLLFYIKNNINHIFFFGENKKDSFIFNASYLNASNNVYNFSGSFTNNNGSFTDNDGNPIKPPKPRDPTV